MCCPHPTWGEVAPPQAFERWTSASKSTVMPTPLTSNIIKLLYYLLINNICLQYRYYSTLLRLRSRVGDVLSAPRGEQIMQSRRAHRVALSHEYFELSLAAPANAPLYTLWKFHTHRFLPAKRGALPRRRRLPMKPTRLRRPSWSPS